MCALCVGVCLLVHIHCCHGKASSTVAPSKDALAALASKAYLEEIFAKYGNGGVLTFDGFERLLHNLGLGANKNETAGNAVDAVASENGTRNRRSVTRLVKDKNARSLDRPLRKRAVTSTSSVTVSRKVSQLFVVLLLV